MGNIAVARAAAKWLLVVALSNALPCGADEEARTRPDVETVVVTASRRPQTLAHLPASVDVISRPEIQSRRADGVAELLRHRAGLHLDAPGARGSRASLYTRGLDPNHTLVMIDGVVVNDETNALGGSYDFSTLDAAWIDRVEIVRGPLSAVHGSAAIAGAINVIPRRPEDDEASADLSGGRFGFFNGRAAAGGRRGPLRLFLAGGYTDEGDPESIGNFRGGSFLTTQSLALPYDAELRGVLRYADSDDEAYPQFSGGPELAVLRDRENRDIDELTTGFTLTQPFLRRFSYLARFALNRRRERRSTPPVLASEGGFPVIPGEPDTRERYLRYGGTLQGTADLCTGIDLTVGGDIYQEDGASRGDLDFGVPIPGGADFDLDRRVGAAFAETQWTSEFGLVALAGLRAELPEGRSEELLPRVAAAYTAATLGTTLQASWGQGFKLPSFFALANPLAGNTDLIPERSKGLDTSIAQELFAGRLRARATYFDIEVDNLIDFNSETFLLENLSSARSRGAELELDATPFRVLELRGHLTYANAEGKDSNGTRRLRNRPRWRGGFEAHWQMRPRLRATLVGLFVGDILDSSAVTGDVRLSGYQRFDLVLAWDPLDWLSLYLAIDNLADEEYEEAVGFPAVGVRPRAGLRVAL